MIIKKTQLEKSLNIELVSNTKAIGIDTATITGVSLITTTDTDVCIDTDLLDMSSVKSVPQRYSIAFDYFNKLIIDHSEATVVIEDVFFGNNVKALIFMSRIGMIAYTVAQYSHVNDIRFINASSSRSKLHLPTRCKKTIVQKTFKEVTGIKFDEENVIDSVILGLNGLLKDSA